MGRDILSTAAAIILGLIPALASAEAIDIGVAAIPSALFSGEAIGDLSSVSLDPTESALGSRPTYVATLAAPLNDVGSLTLQPISFVDCNGSGKEDSSAASVCSVADVLVDEGGDAPVAPGPEPTEVSEPVTLLFLATGLIAGSIIARRWKL